MQEEETYEEGADCPLGFIYGLYASEEQLLRYVGQTYQKPKKRIRAHNTEKGNTKKINWIQARRRQGQQIHRYFIHCCPREKLDDFERFYIKLYTDLGFPLTNGDEGGRGSQGREMSEKTRFLLSVKGRTKNKYRGIFKEGRSTRFYATISIDSKSVHLGTFNTEEEAAHAYDTTLRNKFKSIPVETVEKYCNFPYDFTVVIPTKKILKSSNTTGYRGVRKKGTRRFECKIQVNKKAFYLGIFTSAKEAALAYNEKAIELYGDKAILNVIED